jgi:Zn-dependent M28 family amino/carboxypeptidase
MGWVNEQGEVHGVFEQIQAGAMLRHSAAAPLFENAPVSLETLLVGDENGEELTTFDLEGRIRMRQRSTHETIYSPNVVAVLPGSDPLVSNEYVVYSAHLDHIGELYPEGHEQDQKDLINNGALDNASGVSVMLETARLFKQD